MSDTEKSPLTALVWNHAPSKYSGTPLVALLKIAGLSSRDGHAWPSVKRLALMCGVEERALQYVTKQLEEDGILQIQRRKGHSSRYFLQVAALRSLPSVVPPREEATSATVTPEPAAPAPAPAVEDGRSIAKDLVLALRKENPASALIPLELDDWAAKFQTLIDAGNDVQTIKKVCRFGRKQPFWEIDIQSSDVVTTVVKHFQQMLAAYKKSVEREKEKAA
jgi:hypothetical protein